MIRVVLIILGMLQCVWILAVAGSAVHVPLTIREMDGLARYDNPVNSGIPLPKGAVMDVGRLRLFDDQSHVLTASIEPRARWLGDKSLKWVTVHGMLDSLPPNGVAHWRLSVSDAPLPPSPLGIVREDHTVIVTTGPARFVVPTDRLAPFDQVYVRTDPAQDFTAADALLKKPAQVTLVARNGRSRVVRRAQRVREFLTELAGIDETPFTQAARVESVHIEETGPGRIAVALNGTFSTDENLSLDFTARLYFYAHSSTVQMTFSVRNRQMESFACFTGIERLAVEIPLKLEDTPKIAMPIDDAITELDAFPVTLAQTAVNALTLTDSNSRSRRGVQSDGWIQLTSSAGSLTAGVRWFPQTYPKGLSVGPDGTVGIELKDIAGDRVDLYTGGARTHFMFFRFDIDAATAPDAVAAGTIRPLMAACSPDWYCQETRVMGALFSANPKLYDPRYRDLVARYQERVDAAVRHIVGSRARPGWPVDEYGWLDFGSGLHHHTTTRETASESWWDGNYYDFPLAVVLNYLRTGDPLCLTTAEEAGLHLADIDICHSYPGHPEWAGSPRTGPVVGHFRNYHGHQPYRGHAAFTFYKNESLYTLYYLTGERWYRDVGLMSSDFAMVREGLGALRNLAHGIWGVLSAYRDTHDPRYLERAKFFVETGGKQRQNKHQGGFRDQHWMYGLAFEAYDKYWRISGDPEMPRYLVRALDALITQFWRPEGGTEGLHGINLVGFGLGYEYTGNKKYLQKGLILLDLLVKSGSEGNRVKTFAQNFRGSPYFLKYLTNGYVPRPVYSCAEENSDAGTPRVRTEK